MAEEILLKTALKQRELTLICTKQYLHALSLGREGGWGGRTSLSSLKLFKLCQRDQFLGLNDVELNRCKLPF